MTDQTLDSAFDYLNFRSNSVVISLLPIKARLAGEGGVNVVRDFLRTQPDCTLDQLTQMGLGLLSGNIALCNPPDQAMGFFAPFIQSQLQTITATFPNEIALVPGAAERDAERSALEIAVGPLWHLIFPVLPVPAPAGDCGVRGAQPPRPAALVGLAAVDHRSHCRLDRPGWFSSDRLVPSIDHPNLWSSLPAPIACIRHRRDGQRGREPDAGPGDHPGICDGNHRIVDGYCGKFHNKATKIPNPRLLLKDFPKLVFIPINQGMHLRTARRDSPGYHSSIASGDDPTRHRSSHRLHRVPAQR